MSSPLLWDIFCKVIDNHGDLGVCWRLARQLAGRGQRVRLWVDDASALGWMAPTGYPGVEVRPWTQPLDLSGLTPGDVLVEAFGCEVAPEFIAACAEWTRSGSQKYAWINLEYLSAEPYVERNHGLMSPVMHGPGVGLTKYFFYPGFTLRTGGLLREADLLQRQARFDRTAWLQHLGITPQPQARWVSLFCYEPQALPELLDQFTTQAQPVHLLVAAGRASAAAQAAVEMKIQREPLWNQRQALSISYLPYLTQDDFDHLLWACDLNFVRGEDSLVRALWAGRPFVWQIYPQHDNAHHDKLAAFLAQIEAPDSLRRFHQRWNDVDAQPLPTPDLPAWGDTARRARQQLLAQPDLVSQLLEFVDRIPR